MIERIAPTIESTRANARRSIALPVVASLVLTWSATVAIAAPAPPVEAGNRSAIVRVVDQFGAALDPAAVMACPYEGNDSCNPAHLVVASTNATGAATLRLEAGERYDITAFVRNPSPPWACPGWMFNGAEYYFSSVGNLARVAPTAIEPRHTFVVHRPSPADCVPVHVVDDSGNQLPTAGLFVCPLAADGTPCPDGQEFDGPDADGVIRMAVDPAVTYRLGAFLANSGWACPGYVSPDGTSFHFSPKVIVTGADLIANGLTLVIHHPPASECPVDNATVRVVDDVGNQLTTAGLFVCPLDADRTPCPGGITYDQADADGLIHFVADPTVTYRLGAFVVNPGWPCPGWKSGDGSDFYFSPNTEILGADLIAEGLTLVIHRPTADECPMDNATVRVEDDLGNLLATAGLFVCPLTADGASCPDGTTVDHAEADGLIHLRVDPAVTYRLGGFITDTGWPCEEELGWTSGDGHYFFFTPPTDVLGADLMANGLTLVIHRPDPSECSP